MQFKELVSPSLKELFVKEIESQILSGKLQIGEKLPTERELACQMRVSRAVINSGIFELVHKGFLEVQPRKGTFVADFKRKGKLETLLSIMNYSGGKFERPMFDSLMAVRLLIEGESARLAAARRTTQHIQEMEQYLEDFNQAQDRETLAQSSFNFHHMLSVASGNTIFPLISYGFQEPCLKFFSDFYRHANKAAALTKMRQLLSYIEKQDGAGAQNTLAQMLATGQEILSRYYFPDSLTGAIFQQPGKNQ